MTVLDFAQPRGDSNDTPIAARVVTTLSGELYPSR